MKANEKFFKTTKNKQKLNIEAKNKFFNINDIFLTIF